MLVVLTAIFIVVLLLLIVVVWRYYVRAKRQMVVEQFVAELAGRHSHLSARVRRVENSAVEYVNSLGKDGVALLEELQRRVDRTDYFVQELESLLASGESHSIQEVELFLTNSHPRQEEPERSFDGRVVDLRFNPNWDDEIEGILQKLGESVSNASIAATSVGLPKGRERKSTLLNLMEAGIRFLPTDRKKRDKDSKQ